MKHLLEFPTGDDRPRLVFAGLRALVVATAALLILPVGAQAQGFDFSDDDGWDEDDWDDDDDWEDEDEDADEDEEDWDDWDDEEDWEDDSWEDDWEQDWEEDDSDGFTFGDEEVADDFGPRTVTALIVPSTEFDGVLSDQLTEALLEALPGIENVEVAGNQGLRDEFEIMGAELAFDCAFDPICLGGYAEELGLDQVVIGRVNMADDGESWATTLDLFDASSRTIQNYRFFESAANYDAVEDATMGQLSALFGIIDRNEAVDSGRRPISGGQRLAAIGSGVGGVALIAGGVLMTMGAQSSVDDIDTCRVDGSCTQVQASDEYRNAQNQNTTGGMLIGTGVIAVGVSALLFLVRPGSDIDEGAEDDPYAMRRPTFTFSPMVDADARGFSALIRF